MIERVAWPLAVLLVAWVLSRLAGRWVEARRQKRKAKRECAKGPVTFPFENTKVCRKCGRETYAGPDVVHVCLDTKEFLLKTCEFCGAEWREYCKDAVHVVGMDERATFEAVAVSDVKAGQAVAFTMPRVVASPDLVDGEWQLRHPETGEVLARSLPPKEAP